MKILNGRGDIMDDEFISIDDTVKQNDVLEDRDDYAEDLKEEFDKDDIEYETVTDESC